MRDWHSLPCVDAGSWYCPCYLAELGQCVNCSLLAGFDHCECAWCGSCAHAEFRWRLEKAENLRQSVRSELVLRNHVSSNTFIIKIKMPTWFSARLSPPGSFVFVRPHDHPTHFDVPLSPAQVSASASTVDFAVQVVGPKSRALSLDSCTSFAVRGAYFGGILGLSNLKQPAKHVLIVAKGVAQGCAAHITRYFADRKTPVTLAVGQGSSDAVFARRWLSDGDARIVMLDKTDDHNSGDIRTLIRSTASDLIISAGPDIQHRMLQTLANEIAPRSRTAYTNNALMCCGEGICGSCTVSGAAAPARACKVMPPVNILRF